MLLNQFSENDSYYVLNSDNEYFCGTECDWSQQITKALAIELTDAQCLKKMLERSGAKLKIVESEEHLNSVYLSLLQRIIDITQNAPEAIDVGNQVYNLLYDAGLVS